MYPVVSQRNDRDGLLAGQVFAGMVHGIDEDLGLVLVGGDVVRDLRGPDLAVLVALADRELRDDRGMGGDRSVELGHHLGVVVVPGVLGREVGRGDRDGRHGDEQAGEQGQRGDDDTHGGQSAGSVALTPTA